MLLHRFRVTMAAAWLLVGLAFSHMAHGRKVLDVVTAPPQNSIDYNADVGGGTGVSLAFNHSRLVRTATDFQPEGIHLTPWKNGGMLVSYQTGDSKLASSDSPPTPYDPTTISASVQYGTGSGKYQWTVQGQNSVVYSQVYASAAQANASWAPQGGNTYQSPILHHVLLTGLIPGVKYFYICGNNVTGFSSEFSFTAPRPAVTCDGNQNCATTPFRIGVFGDLGDTANSSFTVDNLISHNVDFLLNTADFTYADQHLSNATNDEVALAGVIYPQAVGPYTDQRRWDSWARFMQPLLSTKPMLSVTGNHEIESQTANNLMAFASANSRHPQPVDGGLGAALHPNFLTNYLNMSNTRQFANEASAVMNNSYYGVSVGPVHIIGLNNYVPFGPTSLQYQWFQTHVATINRKATPWVIVMWHTAAYHTYSVHYREADAFLDTWEPALKAAGVDLVLNGHVHAYERSLPVYNYSVDPCAPTYITIGDGGNIEQLYKTFIDKSPNAYCANMSTFALPAYNPTPTGKSVVTYPASLGGQFCAPAQPNYSAFREPAFGSGTIDILNSTHLVWTWYRTMPGQPDVVDTATISKSPSCPAQNAKVGLSPVPVLSPSPVPSPVPSPEPSPEPSPVPTPSPAAKRPSPKAKPAAKHPSPKAKRPAPKHASPKAKHPAPKHG